MMDPVSLRKAGDADLNCELCRMPVLNPDLPHYEETGWERICAHEAANEPLPADLALWKERSGGAATPYADSRARERVPCAL